MNVFCYIYAHAVLPVVHQCLYVLAVWFRGCVVLFVFWSVAVIARFLTHACNTHLTYFAGYLHGTQADTWAWTGRVFACEVPARGVKMQR